MRIESFERPAFVALRIIAGTMFACHGLQKIFGLLGASSQPAFGSQLWVGGIIELVCGAAIALGLFTRVAALLASGTMGVAYVQFHWKLAFANWKWLRLGDAVARSRAAPDRDLIAPIPVKRVFRSRP